MGESVCRLTYSTLDGKHEFDAIDMVVLSVGLESPNDAQGIADITRIELNKYDFCKTETFTPLETSQEGVVVAGAFQGPKGYSGKSSPRLLQQPALLQVCLKNREGRALSSRNYPEEQPMGDEVTYRRFCLSLRY